MFVKLRHKTICEALSNRLFSGSLKCRVWRMSHVGRPSFLGLNFRCIFPTHSCISYNFATPLKKREENRRNRIEKNNPQKTSVWKTLHFLSFSLSFSLSLSRFSRAESKGAALAAVDAFSNGNILPSSVLHFSQLADFSFSQTLFRLAVFMPKKKKMSKIT